MPVCVLCENSALSVYRTNILTHIRLEPSPDWRKLGCSLLSGHSTSLQEDKAYRPLIREAHAKDMVVNLVRFFLDYFLPTCEDCLHSSFPG